MTVMLGIGGILAHLGCIAEGVIFVFLVGVFMGLLAPFRINLIKW